MASGGWWLARSFPLHTWLGLGVAGMSMTAVFVAGTYGFLLTSEERGLVRRLIWPPSEFVSP